MRELKVCVVDDDQYYNALVRKLIDNAAHESGEDVTIQTYKDGNSCLENSQEGPDLVFLDFYLSTNNDITQTGLDVLKRLKEKYPESHIIFMSQEHEWDKFKQNLIDEGAEDFLKKDDDLPQKINEIFKKVVKKKK
ncbi:MAG: response regulator [Candidatus Cyclobacteriaceae bacterium M2_1C_046]